jgi:hypothetical protein
VKPPPSADPPPPHLGRLGRDFPSYGELPRLILARSAAALPAELYEALAADIRRELQAAFVDGRNTAWTERQAVEVADDPDAETA